MEGLECKALVDGMHLEHVSEFNYLGCALNESGTCGVECRRKVASGRKVAGTIRSLGLQLECAKMLQEELLVPVLWYGSEQW